jgi:hypothetical protein
MGTYESIRDMEDDNVPLLNFKEEIEDTINQNTKSADSIHLQYDHWK